MLIKYQIARRSTGRKIQHDTSHTLRVLGAVGIASVTGYPFVQPPVSAARNALM
jgi:hypothetical protein